MKPRTPRTLPTDESEIEWFYGPSAPSLERSTMGPILERANAGYVGNARSWQGDDGVTYGATGKPTARPTAETRSSQAVEPNMDVIEMYGAIGRRLLALERLSARSASVMAAMWGQPGFQAVERTKNRMVALYALTDAGAKLLASSKKADKDLAQLNLSDQSRLEVLVEAQKRKPSTERGESLARAAIQSDALYRQACADWLQATRGM